MIVLGITGGSGSGKSYVSKCFMEHGGKWIDADAVYHKLLLESSVMRRAILTHFPEASDSQGNINRKKLASMVFTNDKALMELNTITHPFVIQVIEDRIAENYRCNYGFTIIDAIALFESGLSQLCDITVGVIASPQCRLKRIMARDGLDQLRASARINAQQKDEYYKKKCDYIIYNEENTPVDEQIAHLLPMILEETE